MKETIKDMSESSACTLLIINFHVITSHFPFSLIYIVQVYYQIPYQSFWVITKLESAIESRKAYKFYLRNNKDDKRNTNKNCGNSETLKK